jgi:hypothetical protein
MRAEISLQKHNHRNKILQKQSDKLAEEGNNLRETYQKLCHSARNVGQVKLLPMKDECRSAPFGHDQ